MLLAPVLGAPPREIAEQLGRGARRSGWARRWSASRWPGPGFLNLFMADSWCAGAVAGALAAGEGFGAGRPERGERVNVEFVSANPTGPITVASGRHAAYGDALCRILEFAGHERRPRVLRERPRRPDRSASARRSARGRAARSRPRTATRATT